MPAGEYEPPPLRAAVHVLCAPQDLRDGEGSPLVQLPKDFAVMLERMMRQRRHEYRTLQGWLGPTRFEDLPINQLPDHHPDPRVEEGLARVRDLDDKLHQKVRTGWGRTGWVGGWVGGWGCMHMAE